MASVGVRCDGGLLERDGELGLITALVARVCDGEGALLVVEGQAGVGKTELLRAAGEVGKAEGWYASFLSAWSPAILSC